MAKSPLLIAISLFFYLASVCQETSDQSYFGSSKKRSDTAQVLKFLARAKSLEASLPDSAGYYYKKATALAFDLGNVQLLGRCMGQHIGMLNNEARFENGLTVALQHVDIANETNNASVQMKAYNDVANEYEYLGNYEPATEYYLRALQFALRTGDAKMQRTLNNNLGSVFIALKDYRTGYAYSSRACKMSKDANDSVTMANCLVNMSVAELNQKRYQQALQHLDQAEEVGYRIPDMTLVADALSDKGLVYLTRHDLTEAAASYQQQNRIAEKYDLPYEKMYSLFQLALVEKEKGNLENANDYASKAITIGEHDGTADELMEMYDSMSVIKQGLGDFKSALYYKNRYATIDDSLRNQQVETNIHHLNIQFRTAQKDKQIAEQDLRIEKNKTAIERKNMWILVSLAGLAALVVILILSLYSYRHKQHLHRQQLLTMQKEHEVDTLKAKMQAREEERDRIAREMHDDVGSALTTILYLSDDLKTQNRDAAINAADRISSTASSVVDTMNEIIWSMNPDYDTVSDLVAYTRRQCAEFLIDHGIHYELDLPGNMTDLPLSGEQRRNIYLVIKEALHNVVKHANATAVSISFVLNQGRLDITIRDNGVGFQKPSGFGNGLKNMRHRVETIGGHLNIEGGGGTTVKLGCPLYTNPAGQT